MKKKVRPITPRREIGYKGFEPLENLDFFHVYLSIVVNLCRSRFESIRDGRCRGKKFIELVSLRYKIDQTQKLLQKICPK